MPCRVADGLISPALALLPTHLDRKGSTIMTNEGPRVGGVDSHKDTIHVAVITDPGQPFTDREFPTTTAGYRRAVPWLVENGPVRAVGIEGTSSYGVGIAAAVAALGIRVVEVNRTRPAERRKQGKTDRLDAYRAARSVISGEATTDPKHASIEPLAALSVTRRCAVKAQQAAWRQIGALLVNSPAALRDRYRDLPDAKLVATLATTRPEQLTDPNLADTIHALRSLARRRRDLGIEIANLEARMLARATTANPALVAIKGVGPVIGAQLLITAGDNPDWLRSSPSFAALCRTFPGILLGCAAFAPRRATDAGNDVDHGLSEGPCPTGSLWGRIGRDSTGWRRGIQDKAERGGEGEQVERGGQTPGPRRCLRSSARWADHQPAHPGGGGDPSPHWQGDGLRDTAAGTWSPSALDS